MTVFSSQAGIKKWGTDEETFIEIFTTRSFAQLRAMLPEYKKVNTCLLRMRIRYERCVMSQITNAHA